MEEAMARDRYEEICRAFRWDVPAEFNLAPVRDRLEHLQHVIAVGNARESFTLPWSALLEKASRRFEPVRTKSSDPAILIYTSGTTGPPKGALMSHAWLIGNLSGFNYS